MRFRLPLPFLSHTSRRYSITTDTVAQRYHLITTPIFYVNGPPHIGHLYTALLADVFKNWYNMKSNKDRNALLITGTDEHGSKVQKSVLTQQLSSQSSYQENIDEKIYEYCTRVSNLFREMMHDFSVRYDSFVRTTSPIHKKVVACLWRQLIKNDAIYMGSYDGWYCMSDECFQNDVEKIVDPATGEEKVISKSSGHVCEWLSEKNYKFRLSKYRNQVIEWIQQNPNVIFPSERRNEILAALKRVEEDQDLSVSRIKERVHWGIPVPNDPDHVIYVWLDALANYITGSLKESEFANRDVIEFEELKDTIKKIWPPAIQILGKDILKFHAFYWPAFLLALGLPLPEKLIVHSHWTVDKVKMSKSLGNVINPKKFVDDVMAQSKSSINNKGSKDLSTEDVKDYLRYYLLREGNLKDDSSFSISEFPDRINECANAFGNLWTRMFNKRFLPQPKMITNYECYIGPELELISQINKLQNFIKDYFDMGDIKPIIVQAFSVLHRCNELFDSAKPWLWLKQLDQKDLSEEERKQIEKQIETLMFVVAETLRCTAIVLYPILPNRMLVLLNFFNVQNEDQVHLQDLKFAAKGNQIYLSDTGSKILFPKMPPLSSLINTAK